MNHPSDLSELLSELLQVPLASFLNSGSVLVRNAQPAMIDVGILQVFIELKWSLDLSRQGRGSGGAMRAMVV